MSENTRTQPTRTLSIEQLEPVERGRGFDQHIVTRRNGEKLHQLQDTGITLLSRRLTRFKDMPDAEYEAFVARHEARELLVGRFSLTGGLLDRSEKVRFGIAHKDLDSLERTFDNLDADPEAEVCLAATRSNLGRLISARLAIRADEISQALDTLAQPVWAVASIQRGESLDYYAAQVIGAVPNGEPKAPALVPLVQNEWGDQGILPEAAQLVTYPLHTQAT